MTLSTSPSTDARRILIVDDSRAIQAIIRRVVERIGFARLELQSAASGEEALKLIETFQPHLVLSDWHMPRMSGIEMFQTLRQVGLGHIKVGFITTESSIRLLQEARSNGAAFILHKPFRDEDLVREITNVIPLDGAPAPAVAEPQHAPAEPVAPVAPVDRPRDLLLDDEAIQTLVRATLGEIPFRIVKHDGLSVGELSAHNLLGLYSSGTRAVSAVAVMDAKAVCILGGGAAALMPSVVRVAMAAGQPNDQMIELASKFLREAAMAMHLGGGQPVPTLSKANMVPQGLKKLEEILCRSVLRTDCRVSVPGYGDGRFSFLAV